MHVQKCRSLAMDKFIFIEHLSVGADDHIGPKKKCRSGRCGHRPLQCVLYKQTDKLEFILKQTTENPHSADFRCNLKPQMV